MRVRLLYVPPGGGENDWGQDFDLPEMPREGDYIHVYNASGPMGACAFRVRRVWWHLDHPGTDAAGGLKHVYVECEIADSPIAGDAHKQSVAMYEARGKGRVELEFSGY